jgi:hypothetical protein
VDFVVYTRGVLWALRPTYVKVMPQRVLMDLVARIVLVGAEVVAEEAA